MLPLEDIIYAINSFPKAFLTGIILDQNPMTVPEMQERINEEYPYLAHFSFLSRQNLWQYCNRSLSDILDVTQVSTGKGLARTSPGYSLKEASAKDIAKFILACSAELKINPEDYMKPSRNLNKQTNINSIKILLCLYEKGKANVDELSQVTGLDYESAFEYLEHLGKAGLVKYKRFKSEKHQYAFSWVKGKKAKDIDAGLIRHKPYAYSIKRIARVLSKKSGVYDYSKLQELTGYSQTVRQIAVSQLEKQGFIKRISSMKYSQSVLEYKGRALIINIINPVIRAYEKGIRLKANPTEEQLIKAMRMYEKRLSA
jgi:predicted transcriptional regulator